MKIFNASQYRSSYNRHARTHTQTDHKMKFIENPIILSKLNWVNTTTQNWNCVWGDKNDRRHHHHRRRHRQQKQPMNMKSNKHGMHKMQPDHNIVYVRLPQHQFKLSLTVCGCAFMAKNIFSFLFWKYVSHPVLQFHERLCVYGIDLIHSVASYYICLDLDMLEIYATPRATQLSTPRLENGTFWKTSFGDGFFLFFAFFFAVAQIKC